jgi:DNA primase
VGDPRFADEREALKAVVQHPRLVPDPPGIDADDFHHPLLRAVWEAIVAEPLPAQADAGWLDALRQRVGQQAAPIVSRLAIEPIRVSTAPDARLVSALLARLQELTAVRRIDAVKSKLQRTNPVERTAEYNRMFGELVALEQHRRQLRERTIGAL